LRTDDFDFELPRELIAQHPAVPRDSAKLLHVAPEGLSDHSIRELPELLRPGDLLVTNNTKVIPARLTGRRFNAAGGNAKVEVTLHREDAPGRWWAFAKPARKLQPGNSLTFADDCACRVEAKGEAGEVLLDFDSDRQGLLESLERHGIMPLPPYIQRVSAGDPADRADYQTLFAKTPGAVAAPTASLHFTDALLAALAARGIGRVELTLHVGAGTFLPVKSDDVEDHKMHLEWGRIDGATAEAIGRTQASGGRIVAVGTTSLRLLETAADDSGHVAPFTGETGLFIIPGYRFKAVDLLLTNFHLPRSSLFMLVSAFSGLARMQAAYAHAMAAGYRFYSYGDACLLSRENRP
jgi:S-adenosylmethionine:tRNA ribosyltransferase-isomerase